MVLLELPAELVTKIFLNLDFQSVFSFQRVNRLLHRLYQDSAQLQYHVECEIASVDDNPRCSLPIKTRLQMLRDRESTWGCLRPILVKELPPLAFDVDVFGVAGGCYYAGLRASSVDAPSRIPSYHIPTHHKEDTYSNLQSEFSVEGLLEIATCVDENDLVACFVE